MQLHRVSVRSFVRSLLSNHMRLHRMFVEYSGEEPAVGWDAVHRGRQGKLVGLHRYVLRWVEWATGGGISLSVISSVPPRYAGGGVLPHEVFEGSYLNTAM